MKFINSERGNVLIIILIAVALFAALSYTVANMMRGNSDIGREKASIYAAEILTYANSLKEAVQMISISNACEDEDVSFENSSLAGYEHSPVASDNCKIFHPDGGGVSYITPNAEANGGLDWIFTGDNDGYNIGTSCSSASCADLIAIMPEVSFEICRAINKKLNISDANNYMTQEDNYFSETQFEDTYSYTERLSDATGAQALDGKYSGCFEGKDAPQSAGKYYFYQILIAR